MAPRFLLPIFLFFYHFVTFQSVIIFGLKGQQVRFDPNNTRQPDEIMWRHNGKIIVEFNGFEEQVFGSYKGRVTLNQSSAQLQISDLHLEDGGKYECAISMDSNWFRQSYELEVIEKVAKPTITCQKNNSSRSNVSAVLLCSVELNQPRSSLKFKWISKGNVQYGPQLTISLGGELDEKEYTCRVSNPRSSETATFRAKDCYTDAGLSAGMIFGIVFIPIVIVYMGLLILFCTLRRKTHNMESQQQLPQTGSVRENGAEFNNIPLTQIVNTATNVQRSLDEETTQDEEQRPLVEARLTASSPQPQKEPNTENGVIRTDEAAVSDGVAEDMVSHQESCSAPQHSDPKKSSGEQEGPASPPSSLHDNTSSGLEENDSAVNNKLDGEKLIETEETNVAQSSTEAAPAVLDKEKTQDEEKRPLLEDQPTASSPQLQRQLDTENEVSGTDEAEPAAVSDSVTEDMVSHQESCSAPQHSAHDVESQCKLLPKGSVSESGEEFDEMDLKQADDKATNVQTILDAVTTQDEEKRPLLEEPTASSPQPQRQLDTENEVSWTDEANPAAVSDGVTEDMVSHQESCSAPEHSAHDVESQCKLLPKAHDEESQEELPIPGYVRGRVTEFDRMASGHCQHNHK